MNSTEPLNVALYLRVSTEGKKLPDGTRAKGQTVAPQRVELTEYCRRMGWTIEGEWSDVISGSRAARPGLDALLARLDRPPADARRIDAIAVVRLDRIGRSVLNVSLLLDRLDKAGVGLICTAQNIDTRASNPMAALLKNIVNAFSEFERAMIRERTVEGLAAAREKGVVLGRRSKKLIGESGHREAVETWVASGYKGGLRALARTLGGVSPMTAQKIAARHTEGSPPPDSVTVKA